MRTRIFAAVTVLLPLLTVTAHGQFYNLKQYGAGLVRHLVEADVNHDGKPDLVGLSFQQGIPNVTVLLGNGTGGFEAPLNTSVTGIDNPSFPAVADFNGDGNPDVVFVGTDHVTGAAVIALMLGNGFGTFNPAQEIATVADARGRGPVITGDFNGDGKTDVAVAGGDVNVTVLLGKGDGTFQGPLAVPGGGCSVAVADVNNDGNLDLITGNGTQYVRIHLGNGTGSF